MRLHLHEWGDPGAPRVVCLHGVTAHGRRFRKLADERLAGRFRVLAPDLRGHGRSGWEPPWDVEAHVQDVLETVEAEHAVWIGHSFGGRLVLELAAAHGGRVESLVLLDPAVQVLPHVAFDMAEDERKQLRFASADEFIRARLDSGRLFHTPRELLEEEARDHLEPVPGGFAPRYCHSAVIVAWNEMATPAPLAEVGVPVLLVVGDQSWLVGPQQIDLLRASLGDLLTVVTVPGGHTVLWDAFDEAADAIERFLI